MQRRSFIKTFSLAAMTMKVSDFKDQFDKYSDAIMPALFVGHGNPMNAIEDNEFSREWEVIGKKITATQSDLVCECALAN